MAVDYIREHPDEFTAIIAVGDEEDQNLPRTHPEYCDYMK